MGGTDTTQLPFKGLSINNLRPLETDLRPYLLDVNDDQNYSEHILRNDAGISQFLNQLNLPQLNLIDQPLVIKKAFHRSYPNYKNSESKTIVKITSPLKILLIDDMAEEWAKSLNAYLPNAEITNIGSKIDFDNYITEYTQRRKNLTNNFSKMVLDYQDKLDYAYQLSSDMKSINSSISSLNSQTSIITASKIQLLSQKENLEKELFELIGKLTENNGLIDVLISATEAGFEIKDKTKTEAAKLSAILSVLHTKSTELSSKDSAISQAQINLSAKREVLTQLNNQLQETQTGIQSLKSSINLTLNELFKTDFDLVLLDMYLDKTSNNNLIECDGYQIGIEIKKNSHNSPLMIFSASTKSFEQSPFQSDLRFIKGLTPLSDFENTLTSIIANKPLYALLYICDRIKDFNQYYSRKYYSQESSDFEILKLSGHKTTDIKQKISSIIEKLKQSIIYSDENIKKQNFIEIIQLLGNIQENRLELTGQSVQNSYWYATNLEKNKIDTSEQNLHKARNNASHKQSEVWKNEVNIQTLSDFIKTTYEKLLLG